MSKRFISSGQRKLFNFESYMDELFYCEVANEKIWELTENTHLRIPMWLARMGLNFLLE